MPAQQQPQIRRQPVIRVFVSSTFSDLKQERDALQKGPFQRLETLCAGGGFQFQAIDLRWGVSSEASLDHRTMRICVEELRRSQDISPQPNFLILLGNRYGWRPLPEEVSIAEFDQLVAASENVQAEATLRAWYRRDDSNVPPVYVLQSRIGNPAFGRGTAGNDLQAWIDVQDVLWSNINRAFPSEQLARRFEQPATLDGSLPAIVRFQASATEQEIWRGALAVPNAREHVVAFFRELDKDAHGTEFVDADQTPLHDLKKRLEHHLAESNIIRATDVRLHSTDYLQEMCDRVHAALEPIILRQIDEYGSTTPLQRETDEHARFGAERAPASFIGRKDKLDAIEAYLRNESHQPLVIHGESGCGKTALLAKASQEADKWQPIVRYLGVTPGASDVRSLLSSLCQELRQRQPRQDELPADVRDLTKELRAQFDAAQQPLVLFLDAVDQLSDADNGRALNWIPFGPLPAQVKLIVSCLSDRKPDDPAGEPFAALKQRGFVEQNYLNLDALATDEAQTLVFDRWLPEARRQLNQEQRLCIQDRLKTDACRQPLYLKILFEEARLWRSYNPTPQLGANVGDLLNALFKRLEDLANHGPTVEAALGYIASARRGLTETEILEVLYKERDHEESPFKKLLDEMAKKHELPESPPRIPIAIWSRLRFDLGFYLTEHAAPGGTVLNVYHRQVAEYVRGHFLVSPPQRFKCHERLAAFFEFLPSPFRGRGAGGEGAALATTPANVRQVDELPWQRLEMVREARDESLAAKLPTACDRLEKLFEDIFFLEAKTQAGMVFELASEFTKCVEILPEDRPQRRILKLLDEALRRDIHFIARHAQDYPQGLFQCLWNSCWWYDAPEAAGHYDLSKRRGKGHRLLVWLRSLIQRLWNSWTARPNRAGKVLLPWELPSSQRLTSLMESWRVQKEQRMPGFIWLRSQRPPTAHLGTAQKAVLRGHEATVSSVAWSGDGRRIVSGACDNTVRVWDAESGQELLRLAGHGGSVNSVALSGDGRLIVSGSDDKTVRVWDATSGQELRCVSGHRGSVNSVALSGDGQRIVSGSDDNTVRMWDVASGQELLCCGHKHDVDSLALSGDGQRIVSGSWDTWDAPVRVWDATTGQELLCLRGHTNSVDCLAWSGDGGRIVSGSFDRTVRVWDATSGKEVLCLRGHEHGVKSVAFSGDGRRIVSGAFDNTVRVWDAETGREILCLRGHENGVRGVAWSGDGRRIVSGACDNTVRVWDATTGLEFLSLRGHEGEIRSVAWSGDGRRLASGSWDKTVRVWDAASGQEILCLRGHEEFVEGVALNSDGRRIVSASSDKTVRVWDATNGDELLCLRGHEEAVKCVAMSDDDRRIVSGAFDNTVRVWDATNGQELLCLYGHEEGVNSVALSGDGERIVSCGSYAATVRVWDARSGQELLCLRCERPIAISRLTYLETNVAVSGDGRRIVSESSWDETVRVWDATSGECLQTHKGPTDTKALAQGALRFPFAALAQPLETAVHATDSRRPVAWLAESVSQITTHPSGRVWAGVIGKFSVCLFTLEGNALSAS